MNKAEAYAIWAPEGCEWSRWVKPVLFAYMEGNPPQDIGGEIRGLASSYPPASADTLIVADLPGARGVSLGLRLAHKGYRPIPLYNALPKPDLPDSPELLRTIFSSQLISTTQAVVDVKPLISALRLATDELRNVTISANAPPVFLLDSRRKGVGQPVRVGMFDNRSVTSMSDFPSAEYLKDHGVRTVVAIQEVREPEFDLGVVLRQWEVGGLKIAYQIAGLEWEPRPLPLPKPSLLRNLWFWLRNTSTLHRNDGGGFGAFKHASSS